MFTETVTISLERYEKLKRFESMENTKMIAETRELEEILIKMHQVSDRLSFEKYAKTAFDLCRKLRRYEE